MRMIPHNYGAERHIWQLVYTPFETNIRRPHAELRQDMASRGWYINNRSPYSTSSGRGLVGLAEAGLILMRPVQCPSFGHYIGSLREAKRRDGFVYEMSTSIGHLPGLWDHPFFFNTEGLSEQAVSTAAGLEMEWHQNWPRPVLEPFEGFRCYPFNTGLIWTSHEGAGIWVEPVRRREITSSVIWQLDRDHLHPEMVDHYFHVGWGDGPNWKVGAFWELNQTEPLPSKLSLRDAIAEAKVLEEESRRLGEMARRKNAEHR